VGDPDTNSLTVPPLNQEHGGKVVGLNRCFKLTFEPEVQLPDRHDEATGRGGAGPLWRHIDVEC
jgi:hypothetical protein